MFLMRNLVSMTTIYTEMTFGKMRGGGVLIAVNKNICCELLHVPFITGIEQIFLKITVNKIKKVLGCVYIPPDTTTEMYSEHCNVIESIFFNNPDNCFVITGDFNLNRFDWSIDPSIQSNASGNILFNSYINLLNLKQCNCIKNSLDRTLDCIFLSSVIELTSIVHSSESLVPMIDDYHPPLEFYKKFADFSLHNSYALPLVYNFKNCNFNEISLFLSNIDFEINLIILYYLRLKLVNFMK